MGRLSLKNINSYSFYLTFTGGSSSLTDTYIVQNKLYNGKKYYKAQNSIYVIFWSTFGPQWRLAFSLGATGVAIGTGDTQYPWEANWGEGTTFSLLNINNNKISIKKQNLGGGKLNLKKKYLYRATGTGLTPNINGLRFYDAGETFYTNKVFYDETNTYMMWISPAGYWFIKALPLNPFTPGPSFAKAFSNSGEPPTGNYVGGNGYIGTVTISPI